MKEQFTTYEIAKKLKELGFNERCFGCWENNTEFSIPFIVGYDLGTPEYYNLKDYCIAAPLWQQACRFMESRLCKNWLTIGFSYDGTVFITIQNGNDYIVYNNKGFNSYYEALERALLVGTELI